MVWLRNLFARAEPADAKPHIGRPSSDQAVTDWKALGNAALAAGDLVRALECYERGVVAAPEDAALRLNLGFVLLEQGDAAAASERLMQSLALRRPGDGLAADAHFFLGRAQQALGRVDQALASFRAAVQEKAGFAEPMREAVELCDRMGRHQEGTEWARELVRADPGANARLLLATSLAHGGRQAEALQVLEPLCAEEPGNVPAAALRFEVLFALGRYAEALPVAQRVLELTGPHAAALDNLAAVLEKLDRVDEALLRVDEALALDPSRRNAWVNKMAILTAARRIDEATAAAREGLAIDPDNVALRVALSCVLLLQGDFAQGWEEHESRLRSPGFSGVRVSPRIALWGGEDLAGKAIFVYGEQGFGDNIQFVRYLPALAARGGQVILQVPAQLQALLGDLPPDCRLLPQGAPIPPVDFHCPLMSLPHAFGTGAANIPAAIPYLRADAHRVDQWSERLATEDLKVGIAWAGNPGHVNDRNRSIPLDLFRGLAAPGCRFFTVQPDVPGRDARAFSAWADVVHAGRELRDFSDTAALLQALDLVISVDTSVLHLAGALGRPVWGLLPWVPDWRWLLEGDRSAWYPTLRLYRQPAWKDWDSVIARVRDDLAAHAAARA
jgi:tetratricopeptide (TPR) repeat protein